jgi:peptidoglycan/LPS O-acetylase OafA/YrhL
MALGYLYQRRIPPKHRSFSTWLTLAGLAGTLCMAIGVGGVERWVSHVSFYLPAIAAVLYGLATGGWPSSLLRTRPLLVLGDSVYAFYLMQFPLVGTLVWIGNGFRFTSVLDMRAMPKFALGPGFYCVVLVCALVLSVLLFRYFETPWRIRLRRSLGERWLHRPLPAPIIPGQS